MKLRDKGVGVGATWQYPLQDHEPDLLGVPLKEPLLLVKLQWLLNNSLLTAQ